MDVDLIKEVRLLRNRVRWEGRRKKVNKGAWMNYVPGVEAKFFNSVSGYVHCTHKSAPDRDLLFEERAGLKNNRYSIEEWIDIYSKPVLLRAAENYVAANLLHQAGLGPKIRGIFVVANFIAPFNKEGGINAGLYVDDLSKYKKKSDASVEDIERSGVIPDKILSCCRQQINGYVSDLNSVVGAVPKGREQEVQSVYQELLGVCAGSNNIF